MQHFLQQWKQQAGDNGSSVRNKAVHTVVLVMACIALQTNAHAQQGKVWTEKAGCMLWDLVNGKTQTVFCTL